MDGMNLTPHEEELVTQTFVEIVPQVEKATEIFYNRLFEVMPETKKMFSDVEKRSEMFHILATAVKSLSYSGGTGPDLTALGARHVTYEVTLEQFDVVGEVLMWTFAKILGDQFTPLARATWEKVYGALKTSVTKDNYPPKPATPEPQVSTRSTPVMGIKPRQTRARNTPVVGVDAQQTSDPTPPQTDGQDQQDKDKTAPLKGSPEPPTSDK